MNQDIKSQIDRAKNLLQELEESCKLDFKNKSVSEKTKNLTQEVLVKMRHTLDQSMYNFFDKIIAPNLSANDKQKTRIYFPISTNRENIKSILGRCKMANLETTHPDVYNFIESVQPYNTKYSWLKNFSKFANEKHIRLTPQEIREENETRLSNAVHVGRGCTVIMRRCIINDIPVDVGDINRTPLNKFDPRLNVQRTTWISFNFEGSNVNALWLCKKAVNEIENIIDIFFTKF